MFTREEMIALDAAFEAAQRALAGGRREATRFLSPAMQKSLKDRLPPLGAQVLWPGGYPEAERRRAVIAQEPFEDAPGEYVAALKITWNARYGALGHRDLLGSMLATGIDRSCAGDILLFGEGCAYAFVLPEMSAYLCGQWTQAGRVRICVAQAETPEISPEESGEEVRITVQSMRLDAVIAAAFRVARGDAQEWIRMGKVARNWQENVKPDAPVQQGDVISVRAKGRIRIKQEGGLTKKGRQGLIVLRY